MKTLTPTLCGAGAVLVLEIWIACEIFLHLAARNVKRWTLRKLRTIAIEGGGR